MTDRGIERADAVLTYDAQSRAAGERLKTVEAALAAAKACPALYQACQQAYPKACSAPLTPTELRRSAAIVNAARTTKMRGLVAGAAAAIMLSALAAHAQDAAKPAEQAAAPEPYQPGLGDFMALQQMRHIKLWFAGQRRQLAARRL